ncbi:hypothetical protein ABPG75_010664 [Micractinium tetrahymenae]
MHSTASGTAAGDASPPPPPREPLAEPLLSRHEADFAAQPSRLRGASCPNVGGGAPGSTGGERQAGQAAKVLANLVNSGIGTSTVAMPLAVRMLGAGLAIGAMLLQATLGVLANHIISRESARDDADSYHDLMRSRFGKWGGRAVALAQMVNSLGKTVVWLIILADLIAGSSGKGDGLLPELLRAAGHSDLAEGGGWYLRRWPWIVLLAVLATPAVSVRSLDKLSGVSMLGDIAVGLMASSGVALAVIAARKGEAHSIHWLPSKEEAGRSSGAGLGLELASVLPIMMGAAFTQNQINSVMSELRPYRQGLLDVTQAAARALTIAVFLTIGFSNYLVFGPDLKPDVLLNYSAASLEELVPGQRALGLSAAVKFSFLINGLVSLPMYLWPYQRNLWAALPQQSPEESMGDPRSFAATNIASLAGCTLVAVLVPSIWKPLKLLGGTAVSCMAFVFPGLVALRTTRRRSGAQQERGAWDMAVWVAGWVLVAVGLLQMAASIASQFT